MVLGATEDFEHRGDAPGLRGLAGALWWSSGEQSVGDEGPTERPGWRDCAGLGGRPWGLGRVRL